MYYRKRRSMPMRAEKNFSFNHQKILLRFYLLVRRLGKGSSMGTRDDVSVDVDANEEINPSEVRTPLPEAVQEGTIIDEASQGGHRPTEVESRPVVPDEHRPLFADTVNGNWKAVMTSLNGLPQGMETRILTVKRGANDFNRVRNNVNRDIQYSVLDVALMAGQDQLVKNLYKSIPLSQRSNLPRALYHAARRGKLRIVKELLGQGNGTIDADYINRALWIATLHTPRQKEVIQCLAMRVSSSPNEHTILNLIRAGHLDILLSLARRCPRLAIFVDAEGNYQFFKGFVRMDSYYRSGAKLNFWEKCIYQCIPPLVNTSSVNAEDINTTRGISSVNAEDINTTRGRIVYPILHAAPFIKRIGELKLRHECWLELAKFYFKLKKRGKGTPEMLGFTSSILLEAASKGISEIVKLCLNHYPELLWDEELTKKLMEEVVRARHVELFRLINGYNTLPSLMYHSRMDRDLMASLVQWSPQYVPANVSGSAFLMQRELQWFKALDDRCSPLMKSMKFKMTMKEDENDPLHKIPELELVTKEKGKTHWEIFVEQRKDLLEEAGQWMKNTSSSCSLVATLITTVAFAVAFAVPGGNDSTGIPIFLKKGSFMVFAVSDALALFSSVTATLMFLAILTSRYAAEDFHHSLPRKMILGLTFLFLSLAFMLVAFGSALMIVLINRWKWIYIPITLLAAFPAILFVILQLPLYAEMVESTYWPPLYRPTKIWK